MLRQWASTVSDCQKAIQIEPTLIKAHFFMGQALTELENYDDAISSLIKGEIIFCCNTSILVVHSNILGIVCLNVPAPCHVHVHHVLTYTYRRLNICNISVHFISVPCQD